MARNQPPMPPWPASSKHPHAGLQVHLAVYHPALKRCLIPAVGLHIQVVGPTPAGTVADLQHSQPRQQQWKGAAREQERTAHILVTCPHSATMTAARCCMCCAHLCKNYRTPCSLPALNRAPLAGNKNSHIAKPYLLSPWHGPSSSRSAYPCHQPHAR